MSHTDDPYTRPNQIFPKLSAAMMMRAAAYGTQELINAGDFLFERGQRQVDFFILITGQIEILEPTGEGLTRQITLHGACEFTGEIDLFNDRENLVSARATTQSLVTRVERSGFLQMMAAEADMADVVMRALMLRRLGFIVRGQGGLVVLGSCAAIDTLRVQRFMTRNSHPYQLIDIESNAQAADLAKLFGLAAGDYPAVLMPGKAALRNPTNSELADALGFTSPLDASQCYDVAVIGAGPAGLAAAVYAASEGLRTIVIEGLAPGGQAGTSSNIENYLGFPAGVSGQALAARAQIQAQKFGVHLLVSHMAVNLDIECQPFSVALDDAQAVHARSVVIATGAQYRKMDSPGCARFKGQGVHYAATAMEARLCSDQDIIVAGGGNSAGQAAVFLSRTARHVHVLVRSSNLAATMSDYLVQRITLATNITLHTHAAILQFEGGAALERVHWEERTNGERHSRDVRHIFIMIGASPNTQWLHGCLAIDEHGFICTAVEGGAANAAALPFQTSQPGIFAVGDVRSGSVKRVASGVGEGSAVVQAIHRYLRAASEQAHSAASMRR